MISIIAFLLISTLPCNGQGSNEAIYGRNIPTCTSSEKLNYNGTSFVCETISAGSIPAGSILLIDSGTCPTGFSEVSGLDTKTLLGTLAANKDVGTTGGNDNITPSGTNSSLTFTGNSNTTSSVSGGTPTGTNSAPTFTGNSSTTVVNHLHTLATGTGSTGNFSQVIGTVDTSSGGTGGTPTQTALGTLSGNPTVGGAASYTPTGSVSAPTFTGNALGTHSHTVTPTGSINTPTFTGNSFDNRSAFVKVIFCKKT